MKLTPEKKIEFIKAGYITNMYGGEYIRAHGRIILFKDAYPEWGIRTDIIREEEGKYIIMKAEIIDEKGMVRADGIRSQRAGESFREKCQTCAISRALANLGIGIEFGVAGAEEIIDFYNTPEGKAELAKQQKNKGNKQTIKIKEVPEKEKPIENKKPKLTKKITEDTISYLIKHKNEPEVIEKALLAFKEKYGEKACEKISEDYDDAITAINAMGE